MESDRIIPAAEAIKTGDEEGLKHYRSQLNEAIRKATTYAWKTVTVSAPRKYHAILLGELRAAGYDARAFENQSVRFGSFDRICVYFRA